MKVCIVGAGVMGRLLAFYFVKMGYEVSVFEQFSSEPLNCSFASAGLLTPVSELEKSDPVIYQLGQEAMDCHWPAILNQLDSEIYFKKNGSLILSHPKDEAELTHFIHRIENKLSHPFYQRLNQSALAHYEPALQKFAGAYYVENEAHLDSQALLIALYDTLKTQGVEWNDHAFVNELDSGKIKINHQTKHFDWVFDCRGRGGQSNFSDLFGIRGELIWVRAKEIQITRPIRFLHPRYSLYLAPRPDNIYLIGATEIQSENRDEISVRSTLELLTALFYLHPGFAEANILKTITQCRPTLPDYLPKIKYKKGLIAINGLYRHGFLIAPTLVNEILTYLKNGVTSLQYSHLWEKFYDEY